MRLYITTKTIPALQGFVMEPMHLNSNVAHLSIASRKWEAIYLDLDDCIEEGKLRFLNECTSKVLVSAQDPVSRHQMILLTELFPDLAGKLRKAFMRGESITNVLPEVWEYREEA